MALLHLQSGIYYGLNGVGARIWHLLGAGRPLVEVREALLQEFDVDAARCEQDLRQILEQMAAAELVIIQEREAV